MPVYKKQIDVKETLKENIESLSYAVTHEGPYVLKVNGVEETVTREKFLDFFINVVAEDLEFLLDELEELEESDSA